MTPDEKQHYLAEINRLQAERDEARRQPLLSCQNCGEEIEHKDPMPMCTHCVRNLDAEIESLTEVLGLERVRISDAERIIRELCGALEEATASLQTLSLAGFKGSSLEDMTDVHGYANSRHREASAALARVSPEWKR